MKERPIIFSAPMVRALLEGRKTQTRRVVKFTGRTEDDGKMLWGEDSYGEWYPITDYSPYHNHMRLWVRERWRVEARELQRGKMSYLLDYEADPGSPTLTITEHADAPRYVAEQSAYRPAMFMPRWASRITLEIVGVRVERVQDISQVDAMQEGMQGKHSYAVLWDTINVKRGYGWDSNPWVWAISFRMVTP